MMPPRQGMLRAPSGRGGGLARIRNPRSGAMRLADDTQKTYPKFKHYIEVDFPKLIHVHPIVNGLKKYGLMSTTEVHEYLAWGSGPRIVDMTRNIQNTHFPFVILIDENYLKNFEADSPERPLAERLAVGKNSHGKLVYKAGVNILEQLVHDSAYRTLKTSADPGAAQEQANSFLQEIYGGLVQ
jgi:Metallopeptidase toxin 3